MAAAAVMVVEDLVDTNRNPVSRSWFETCVIDTFLLYEQFC